MPVAEASRILERAEVEKLVREVLTQRLRGRITPPPARERHAVTPSGAGGPPHPLVVNVSARHMHVTPADLEVLFGSGAKLTKLKDLYQEGDLEKGEFEPRYARARQRLSEFISRTAFTTS